MNTNDYFLNQLPKEFTRKEALKLVVQSRYSISKANDILEYGIYSNKIKRIKRGVYQKVDDIILEVRELYEQGLSYREISEIVGVSKSQVGNYINSLKKGNLF